MSQSSNDRQPSHPCFTPGPWHIGDHCLAGLSWSAIYPVAGPGSPNEEVIALLPVLRFSDERAKANAALLRLSPELYSVAKDLIADIDVFLSPGFKSDAVAFLGRIRDQLSMVIRELEEVRHA